MKLRAPRARHSSPRLWRTWIPRSVSALLCLTILGLTPRAEAQAILDLDRTNFMESTGAAPIPFPASDSFPSPFGFVDFGCVDNLTGFALPTGDPQVTVTAPLAIDYICMVGPGGDSVSDPQAISPTIVGNGEDDYELVFDPPVSSIGLDLLTNHFAVETITVEYTDGTSETFEDAVLGTMTHSFEFVGLIASGEIDTITIDTTGGGTLNEGIFGILLPRTFVRADCNGDLTIDIGDPVAALGILFSGAPGPLCGDACDTNDDGVLDIADAVSALSYLFVPSSPAPPSPFPDCGFDPTADDLECSTSLCP